MEVSTARRAFRAGACILAVLALAGCSSRQQSMREVIGLDKAPPDEFLVVTKAPLIIPPDMELRPPDPGAPPTAANNPAAVAEGATLGARSAKGTSSRAEAELLARAGTDKADPRIRRRLRAENLRAKEAEETVANRVLRIQRDEAETLNAEEEAARLRQQKTGKRVTVEDILQN